MVTDTSLKYKTMSALLWNFTELMLRRSVSTFTTLVLAWFLRPEDFGLLAMMTVFLAFSDVLVDAGLSQALIRKESITQRELSTAFFTNISIAALTYLLLFFYAPYIALFYEQPALESLIRVAGVAIIFNALIVVQQATLSRALKFKLQLQVTLPAAFLSGVIAISSAYSGLGVWALIIQVVSQSFLTSLLYWRLRLWSPSLEFGRNEFRELFSFSGYLLLAQMTNVPFKNMYVIVIAKVYASAIAGLYYFAEKIRDLILNQLVNAVERVTYPSLSQLQSDNRKLKQGYRQVISVTTFLVFPVLIFLAALVNNVFTLLLPTSWLASAPYLQLMCMASLMYPLHAINLNILKVKGRSDLVFYLGLVKRTTAVLIFLITYQHGINAIIFGQIINSLLSYIPNSYYSRRLIDYTVMEQIADFMPAMLLAGVVGFCLWVAQSSLNWNVLIELILLGSGSGFIYLTGARLLKLSAFKHAKFLLEAKFGAKNIHRES